jgi:hypothetical protein
MEHKNENRVCQNCKNDFTIEPDDFSFYDKIKVPPPTFCPECRMIRRMIWRNVRNLYRTNCSIEGHGEKILSVYSSDKPLKVSDKEYWWSDKFNALDYGKDYDFSKPFFIQFIDLLKQVPLPNVGGINMINSDYTNMTIDSKNCYLVFSANRNENCYYSDGINDCKNSMDLLSSRSSDLLYESVDCNNCFSVSFGIKASGCIDSMFLYDCRNCSNCFGCWNLRNKQYYIFNEKYNKDEYFKKIKSFKIYSYVNLSKINDIYKNKLAKSIRKFADITSSENVSGNSIEHSNNCHNAFDIFETNNSKYVSRFLKGGGSDNYDITTATNPELCYESNGIGSSSNTKFGIAGANTSDSYFIFSCVSSSKNLFGCVSINKGEYCILNKQYTKEEYEELIPKIIKHMNDMPYIDSCGRIYKYGEFFPSDLSPFCYNETIAQEYFPLTKEQAIQQGYKWKEKEERNYTIDIKNEDIPDNINDITDDITTKIIECAHKDCNHQCTEAFKIIPEELTFYRRMNLPIPRLCPNCRHGERIIQRNPMKLWHRSCMKEGCTNEFETSYAPERPEIVYCEKCYQGEVY